MHAIGKSQLIALVIDLFVHIWNYCSFNIRTYKLLMNGRWVYFLRWCFWLKNEENEIGSVLTHLGQN